VSALTRVRPTKIELIRLKRRLTTSIRVRKILGERLTILVNEFMAALLEAVKKRKTLQKQLLEAYRRAEVVLGIYGPSALSHLETASPKPKIYVGTENIMGVKVKTIILKYSDDVKLHPAGLNEFAEYSRQFIQVLLDLAKLENELYELGREISSTKRKTNALEHIIIPRLRETIRQLQLKFDEREREEKARFKRIKQVLTRKKTLEQ